LEHLDQGELDDRKAAILKAVVEAYVETAQPVGSQTIARVNALSVSSATVRNDMTILEREGYLTQPHTSAGRVPTDRAYRYFVDHYTREETLPAGQRRAVADFFASAHRALEDLLTETSQLLSRVSRHAALVMGPEPDLARICSVQFVGLQPGVALLVVVLSNGAVHKETVTIPADADDERLHHAGVALDGRLRGRPWAGLPDVPPTGDAAVDELIRLGRDLLAHAASDGLADPLYVGGVSRLAAEQEAFETSERAARLFEVLEHQVLVVSLVRELLDRGLTVSIGAENGVDDLRDCAIVLAPYQVGDRPAGIVGVLGPTRMNYRHALAAVSAVSDQLGRHLS
jgi:heat-inducible transcriptional repressor